MVHPTTVRVCRSLWVSPVGPTPVSDSETRCGGPSCRPRATTTWSVAVGPGAVSDSGVVGPTGSGTGCDDVCVVCSTYVWLQAKWWRCVNVGMYSLLLYSVRVLLM